MPGWAEALIGFAGVVVGSATTLVTTWLTQRGESARQRQRNEQARQVAAAERLRESSTVVLERAMKTEATLKQILLVGVQRQPHQMDPNERRRRLVELARQTPDDIASARVALMLDPEGREVLAAFDKLRARYNTYVTGVLLELMDGTERPVDISELLSGADHDRQELERVAREQLSKLQDTPTTSASFPSASP